MLFVYHPVNVTLRVASIFKSFIEHQVRNTTLNAHVVAIQMLFSGTPFSVINWSDTNAHVNFITEFLAMKLLHHVVVDVEKFDVQVIVIRFHAINVHADCNVKVPHTVTSLSITQSKALKVQDVTVKAFVTVKLSFIVTVPMRDAVIKELKTFQLVFTVLEFTDTNDRFVAHGVYVANHVRSIFPKHDKFADVTKVLFELHVKSTLQILATSTVILAVHAVVNVAVSCARGTRTLHVEPLQVVQLIQFVVTGAAKVIHVTCSQSQHHHVIHDTSNGAHGQVKFTSCISKLLHDIVHQTYTLEIDGLDVPFTKTLFIV